MAETIRKYVRTSKITRILDDLVRRLKESKTLTVFGLESLKLALELREKQLQRTGKIDNFVWIEHYSKALRFFPEDRYAIVSFEPQTWTPQWCHYSVEHLSTLTGYPMEDLLIPEDLILA